MNKIIITAILLAGFMVSCQNRNNYGKDLKVGICSQAPQKDVCVSEFSELKLNTDNVKDFRMGD